MSNGLAIDLAPATAFGVAQRLLALRHSKALLHRMRFWFETAVFTQRQDLAERCSARTGKSAVPTRPRPPI